MRDLKAKISFLVALSGLAGFILGTLLERYAHHHKLFFLSILIFLTLATVFGILQWFLTPGDLQGFMTQSEPQENPWADSVDLESVSTFFETQNTPFLREFHTLRDDHDHAMGEEPFIPPLWNTPDPEPTNKSGKRPRKL